MRYYRASTTQGAISRQINDAVEVVEFHGQAAANGELAEGWKLLAVLPAVSPHGGSTYAVYVMGKAKVQGDPLGGFNPANAGQP